MRTVAAWFAGAMIVLLSGTAIVIFGFGYFEPGFGRGYSLKLALLIGLVLAAIGGIAYASTTMARRWHPTLAHALIAGAVYQTLLFAAIEGVKRFAPTFDSLLAAVVVAAVLGAASSLVGARHVA